MGLESQMSSGRFDITSILLVYIGNTYVQNPLPSDYLFWNLHINSRNVNKLFTLPDKMALHVIKINYKHFVSTIHLLSLLSFLIESHTQQIIFAFSKYINFFRISCFLHPVSDRHV